MSHVELWWDGGAALAESPLWCAEQACFYWVDISGQRIWRHDGSARPAQNWQLDQAVGCIALRAGGGLVAALQDGVYALELGAAARPQMTLLAAALHGKGLRFNDGRCDRQGRFWVGSMHEDPEAIERLPLGRLARLAAPSQERDGPPRPFLTPSGGGRRRSSAWGPSESTGCWAPALREAMLVPNGLAFSPSGDKLYFSDSAPTVAKVWVCDYDPASGQAADPRVFIDRLITGRPDGAAVDVEGCYWICANDGAAVLRYTPTGQLDRRIELPVAKPTMCAFGGADMATLLITSMRPAGAGVQATLAGALFALRPGVTGLPETPYAD
ncbi:SMP-30/gluconolactonase/LRE family protein [Paucibacter sp. B2R-40]|uniref:SMP-30/gluconolactonase/LRE family protein n=1 Tax=Paucibacter sp. B2R-40 TaxID=2893554 RepID=UPI0021E441D9|nr:SMP-30/gluconolactonase/LRE family protein [Paucibacter sp. B2R-40]MCV2354324.1 SMP-30/gluconolactonase/LRE family protein [Paucibacter sp. B2R-40]